MPFVRDRGFATKLFAMLALMLVTLAIAATWSEELGKTSARNYGVALDDEQAAGAVQALERNLDAAALAAAAYALSGDSRFKDEYRESVDFEARVVSSEAFAPEADSAAAARSRVILGALDRFHSAALVPLVALGDRVAAGESVSVAAALGVEVEMHDATHGLLHNFVLETADEVVRQSALARDGASAATRVQIVAPIVVGLVAAVGFGVLAVTTRRRLGRLRVASERIGSGDLSEAVCVGGGDEIGHLAAATEAMRLSLQAAAEDLRIYGAARDALVAVSAALSGAGDSLTEAAAAVLDTFVERLGAVGGVLYVARSKAADRYLERAAGYADDGGRGSVARIPFGEGLAGRAAQTGEIMSVSVPTAGLRVRSSLVDADPVDVLIVPCMHEDVTIAVIEVLSLRAVTDTDRDMAARMAERVGVGLATLIGRERVDELLAETQSQAEELQTQTEELQTQAEELQTQTEELEAQQDELAESNGSLEAKSVELEEQKAGLEEVNAEVEAARAELVRRADMLEQASRYKSQFLANMSHELRTPLNSLLVLSETLARNKTANLTDRQIECAQTIHSAGKDLLALINEVLDLAKVEAGRISLERNDIDLGEVVDSLKRTLGPLADQKGLSLAVTVRPEVSALMRGDRQRLDQILRNLVGNACKFTSDGGVDVTVREATPGEVRAVSAVHERAESASAAGMVAFDVADTGIGIAAADMAAAFEPFQQLEGGSARRFGGTGLGLSISRELARAMGGDILVTSEVGVGSTFTLCLPADMTGTQQSLPRPDKTQSGTSPAADARFGSEVAAPAFGGPGRRRSTPSGGLPDPTVRSDSATGTAASRVLLIVEDNPDFAGVLADLAGDQGFSAVIAATGAEAIALAQARHPDAITLDLSLPDTDGWVVLDRLRRSPELRHIPVHVISGRDDADLGVGRGAIGSIAKPASSADLERAFRRIRSVLDREIGRILIIEDDPDAVEGIVAELDGEDVELVVVANGTDGLAKLAAGEFDCVVTDLGLPDMSGFALIDRIRESESYGDVPILVYTGRELSDHDRRTLERQADAVIIKDTLAPARLLDETSLFLHRVTSDLPEAKRRLLTELYTTDPVLSGRKILVVDDDSRNVFALANVLEDQGVTVVDAENGQEGIDQLAANPDVDIVLMDVMMPVMDGYEAMRIIRRNPAHAKLPIIALTALAMPEDRQACLEAGASDYMHKPVDTEQLISLLRVWLQR